ncbi:5'/3'-nucleotidase SurE [Pseudomonadales bacterium]|nr:5'/3'-nucleotidase SurE [Pseudomonadales bacterium]MDC1314030.1 5'/3'-nucleotidase SurE [Pseudomonadales bacterium]
MRALLTNDDGIDSPGLHELARHVEAAGFEVVVVAPSFDASGTGASLGHISRDRPIGYQEVQIIGLAGKAFALDGPPALCTITSHLEAFGPRPDIVVSGPNLGLNTGRSVLHSGTVGAALAAQNFGMRGLAVSLAVSEEWQFDTACRYAIELLNALANGPERCALNLNVPALPYAQTKGLRWGGLAEFGSVRSQIVDQAEGKLFFDLVETEYNPPADSDLGLVNAGFAAVTSLQCSAEVWTKTMAAGDDFSLEPSLPSASASDRLQPPQSFLD